MGLGTVVGLLLWYMFISGVIYWTTYDSYKYICSMNTGVLAHKLNELTHYGGFILCQIYYVLGIQMHLSLKLIIPSQLVVRPNQFVVGLFLHMFFEWVLSYYWWFNHLWVWWRECLKFSIPAGRENYSDKFGVIVALPKQICDSYGSFLVKCKITSGKLWWNSGLMGLPQNSSWFLLKEF